MLTTFRGLNHLLRPLSINSASLFMPAGTASRNDAATTTTKTTAGGDTTPAAAGLKRPLTPYMMFYQENLNRYKRERPNSKLPYWAQLAGQEWKALPDAKKQEYEKVFRARSEAYKAALEANPELVVQKRKTRRQEKNDTEIRKVQREISALVVNRPKKRITGHTIFMSEKMPQVRDMKVVSEIWRNLSDAEKAQYQDKANTLLVEANRQYSSWQQEIESDGRDDLLKDLQLKLKKLKLEQKEMKGEN